MDDDDVFEWFMTKIEKVAQTNSISANNNACVRDMHTSGRDTVSQSPAPDTGSISTSEDQPDAPYDPDKDPMMLQCLHDVMHSPITPQQAAKVADYHKEVEERLKMKQDHEHALKSAHLADTAAAMEVYCQQSTKKVSPPPPSRPSGRTMNKSNPVELLSSWCATTSLIPARIAAERGPEALRQHMGLHMAIASDALTPLAADQLVDPPRPPHTDRAAGQSPADPSVALSCTPVAPAEADTEVEAEAEADDEAEAEDEDEDEDEDELSAYLSSLRATVLATSASDTASARSIVSPTPAAAASASASASSLAVPVWLRVVHLLTQTHVAASTEDAEDAVAAAVLARALSLLDSLEHALADPAAAATDPAWVSAAPLAGRLLRRLLPAWAAVAAAVRAPWPRVGSLAGGPWTRFVATRRAPAAAAAEAVFRAGAAAAAVVTPEGTAVAADAAALLSAAGAGRVTQLQLTEAAAELPEEPRSGLLVLAALAEEAVCVLDAEALEDPVLGAIIGLGEAEEEEEEAADDDWVGGQINSDLD